MVYRWYEACKQNKNDMLECPHCFRKQEDTVIDHCVIGRPDRSKSECLHCRGVFGVVALVDAELYVLKLHNVNDNIN